jgi:hypothetical protein
MATQGKFEYHIEGSRVYPWSEPKQPFVIEELSAVVVGGRRSQTLLLYDGNFQLIDHVYDSFSDPRRESLTTDATSSSNSSRLQNIIQLFDKHFPRKGKVTARKQRGDTVANRVDRYARASVNRWCQ